MASAGEPEVYRTYEDGYKVRAMRPSDAPIVQKWYSGMGAVAPGDLDVALDVYSPGHGLYIGEYEGEVVASAVRLPWGDNIYYGSYYYVEKKYRSKGFGTRLRDQVAKEHVGNGILAIDAVEAVQEKNAAKFGYLSSFTTRRYTTERAKADYGATCDGKLVQVSDVPFQDLVNFDDKHFVVKNSPIRRRFLEKWFHVKGGATYVTLTPGGEISGFGCRRPCVQYQARSHIVGPLYAESPSVARVLLQRLCQDVADQQVTVDMWVPNQTCLRMMEDFGFVKVFDILRMHLNGKLDEYKDTVFAVTSIDVCGF